MKRTKQIRRLLKLADIVEKHEDQFDMNQWIQAGNQTPGTVEGLCALVEAKSVEEFVSSIKKGHTPLACGTGSACIGGWAVLTWPDEIESHEAIETAASRVLGYNYDTLEGLFDMYAPWKTSKAAARELRRRAAVLLDEELE